MVKARLGARQRFATVGKIAPPKLGVLAELDPVGKPRGRRKRESPAAVNRCPVGQSGNHVARLPLDRSSSHPVPRGPLPLSVKTSHADEMERRAPSWWISTTHSGSARLTRECRFAADPVVQVRAIACAHPTASSSWRRSPRLLSLSPTQQ